MANGTSLPSIYKTRYTDQEVLDLTFKGRVLWALIAKGTDFGGDSKKIPMLYAPSPSRSATFSTALANGAGLSAEAFFIKRAFDYQVIKLDGDDVEASEGDENAFMTLFETNVEGGIANLGRELNRALYRDQSGARGQVATSGITTTVLTLENAKDAVAFEAGMVVKSGPNADGTSLASGTATIKSVDRSAGTLTATANWTSGISAITDAYYLFADGDATKKITGLDAYCPSTAPAVTTGDLWGMARSNDPDRLGGIRVASSMAGLPLEEAFLILNDTAFTIGEAEVDLNLINSLRFTDFAKELGSKKEYQMVKAEYPDGVNGDVGFKGIVIHHAGGSSVVLGDRDCQDATIWGIEKKTLKWEGLGMTPRPLNVKGTSPAGATFDPNADGLIMRLGWRGQLACRGPALIARGTIA